MTYLLLSDVHAHMGALEAVLTHAEKHGWDAFSDPVMFLGDAVGCGREPNEVLDRLRELNPAVAPLTLAVSALTRSYYSGTALVVFVAVWSAWLTVGHLSFRRFAPPTRALLIGNPSFAAELRPERGLELTTAHTPPDTFDAWDIAVVESSKLYSEAWLQWLAHADIAGVRVVSALAFNEVVTGRVSTEVLHGRWAPLVLHGRSPYAGTKRVFDLAVTLLALPLLLPVAGLVALAVLLDGGCPVLFWQERIGKDGQPFRMVKFRSVRRDSEAAGAAFATQGDLRVTRVGAFLRRYRLDELPQFYNVLRGEMSVIGPRPEQEAFVRVFSQDIPLYSIRHHVRPGITGWAARRHRRAGARRDAADRVQLSARPDPHRNRLADASLRDRLAGSRTAR